MNFHDVQMPRFMEAFAVGKPEFSTSCALTISGRELRNLDCEQAKQRYLFKNCFLSQIEFEQFNSFFRARRGRNFSFRFRDLVDYQVVKQFIANGDGYTQEFPLVKLYADSVSPYFRTITKPVKGSIKIYLENEEIDADVNYDKGILNLGRPLAREQILLADFIFDVAVRFSNDSFEYNYCNDGSVELEGIELLEVME